MTARDDRTSPGLPKLNRRQLAGAGAALVGATALGLQASGADIPSMVQQSATPGTEDGFIEPPVLASKDGHLNVTLQAMVQDVTGSTRMGYNDLFPGPTLRFRPGDTVKVALVNALPDMTNLHVHGLHVSPKDNSDNVFVHVQPGQTFGYEFRIPENHRPGTYWYHPHPHGISSEQVGSGLAGAIIIEGGLDDLPGIAGLRDRLLTLQGPYRSEENQPRHLVNGQVNPTISIRPGETQRWRIANMSANAFYNLQLVGHQLHRIAADGNPLARTETVDVKLLGPGERTEVLVQGGSPGIYELRSLAFAPDIPSQAQEEFLIATVVSGGDPVEPQQIPTTLIELDDLSNAEIAEHRTITFMENTSAPVYAIDDKAFVEDRVDQVVKLGTTEEWTLRNTSNAWHPFHIHVNDFQVMSINGSPMSPEHHDTVLLPPNGEIVIRMQFLDFTGRFVYHCHILAHEDSGMMAVIEVVE